MFSDETWSPKSLSTSFESTLAKSKFAEPCWPLESAVSVFLTINLVSACLSNTVPNLVVELLSTPLNERLKFKAQVFHLVLYTNCWLFPTVS